MIAMNNEVHFQYNKLLKLDNTMLMYGIYNVDIREINYYSSGNT